MSFYGNFEALAASTNTTICPVLELTLNEPTWNGSTEMNLSDSAVLARGKEYDARVVRGGWGSVTRSIDVQASGLSGLGTNVTIADADGKVRAAFLDAEQRNSVGRIFRVIPASTGDYASVFTGLLDSVEFLPGQVRLVFKTDERVLRSNWPAWPYLSSEWFAMDLKSVGKFIPLLYGKHDSTGLSGKGMLPTVLVWGDGANSWYAVHLGPGDLIKNVYVADVLQSETAYNKVYGSYVGGKIFTIIEFLAPFPAADAVVTCDTYGYAAAVDGVFDGAATLTNPVSQIRHFLVNFAVDGSKGYNPGVWNTAASIIDGPSWNVAAAYALEQGLEGSRFIGGSPRQVLDIFREWLESFPMFKAYWNAEGKIALSVLSARFPGVWAATKGPVFRQENEFENSFRYESDTSDITRKISAQYLHDEVQGSFLRSLVVQDLSVDVLSDSTVDLFWSPARQV